MNFLQQMSLDEKMAIDNEIEEMEKYPIDYSDIPPLKEYDTGNSRFGNERMLRMLPPDIVQEMARRRLAEIKNSDYENEDLVLQANYRDTRQTPTA